MNLLPAFIALLLGLSCAFPAVAACGTPAVLSPAQHLVAERHPRIEWQAVTGATGYRLRLVSRVPNGRILASHDTVVASNAFLAPQPLADQRAKVTLRINAICGTESGAETAATFIIDTSPKCVLDELSVVVTRGGAELMWKQVVGAARYEIRAFTLDGRLLSASETRASPVKVDLPEHGAVVSVRPDCAGGLGEAVYRTVAAD